MAEWPQWILDQLMDSPEGGGANRQNLPRAWQQLVAEGIPQGRRNDAIAQTTGYLLGRRVDAYLTLDLMRGWNELRCNPPLPDDEVCQIVDSISRRELAQRKARRGK